MSRSDGFQLLIYDWDGTLVDSIGTIVECTQRTLEALGLRRVDDDLIRGGIGLGLREMVNGFLPGCDDEQFNRIVEVYRRLWFDTYRHRPRLFPDSRPVLAELGGDGYLQAVATAKSRRGLDHDLEATGLRGTFDATRTVDESRSKPHPQMILDILDELGVDAAVALMIGDTSHDIEMAHNAGARAVGVLTGSHSREELDRASPLATFEHLEELTGWLGDGERGTPGR